jgi:hypothetical protein
MTTQPEQGGGSVYLLHFEPGLPVTADRAHASTSASPSTTSTPASISTCAGRAHHWSLLSWLRADA